MNPVFGVFFFILCLEALYIDECETTPAYSKVQSNYDSSRNKSYSFHNKSMDWTTAQTYCVENGGRLATIMNFEEDNLVQSVLPEHGATEYTVWLGGVCLVSSRPCYWISPNQKICGYHNFYPTEPSFGSAAGCVSYATKYKNTWYWVEKTCSDPYFFICENF